MMKVAPSDYERARVDGLDGHLKFFQLSVKSAGGYTERFCGLGFVAVGLAQRILDYAAFSFFDVDVENEPAGPGELATLAHGI